MATAEQLTDEQFDRRVLGILRRELNVAEFARYLHLHRTSTQDYTAERHKWLDHLTIEDVLAQIKQEETNIGGEP